MKRKITHNELRQIRSELDVLFENNKNKRTLIVSVILPEPCNKETLDFALYFCLQLKKINCEASISELLQFPYRQVPKKDFEVMQDKPLGIPCIRVFTRPKQQIDESQQCYRRITLKWWSSLLPLLSKRASKRRECSNKDNTNAITIR